MISLLAVASSKVCAQADVTVVYIKGELFAFQLDRQSFSGVDYRVHVTEVPRPFNEVARECVEAMDWGDQPYGKEYLYQLAFRVHAELERDRWRREMSWWRRMLRLLYGNSASSS